MLSFPRVVACSRTCSRFLGLSLGTASLFAAGANIALLFPNWDTTYLMRGLIGKHAMLGAGLWGGGFMVLVAATLISLTGYFSNSAPCRHVTIHHLGRSGQKLKAGTWTQELKKRPWRGAAYWLASRLMMLIALLSSSLALLGALVCFVTSGVALKDGPFCMFDTSSFNQTQAWKFGYPFKDLPNRNYLYDHSLWTSVCLEPSKAVVWHVAFFSTLVCISLLQLLLVAIHLVNSILGLFCSFCEKS